MAIVVMYGNAVAHPEGPTVGFLVWRLAMKWRTAVDRAVEPLGLTHAQYSLLASLLGVQRAGQRPSQRQLADHIGLEPVYVSKLARALESRGLITRPPREADTRAVELVLTDHGREIAGRATVVVHELLDQLAAPLGGTRGAPTRAFARDLQILLEAPSPTTTGGTT